MPIPDEILALRPGNAAACLPRGSGVLVANPADLLRALPSTPLCTVVAAVRPVIAGLVHAAKSADACLGFTLPAGGAAGAFSPRSFFAAVVEEAQSAGLLRPIFLQAEGLPAPAAEGERARARERAFSFVDAGFTWASFDPGTAGPEEAVAALAEVAEPFLERELPVELLVPADVDVTGLAAWAAAAPPAFGLVLRGPERAVELGASLKGRRLSVLGGDRLDRTARTALAGAGLARVAAGETTTAQLVRSLPGELGQAVLRHAAESGLPLEAALGPYAARIGELAPAFRDRIESHAYHELHDLLRQLGAEGSGRRALEFLAGGGGY